MLMHPEIMMSLANDRHRELVAEADRGRLLRSARRVLAARREPVRGQPATATATGTLAPCESTAVAPAR
ncbi:hypothetical protein ACTI_68410 [Actinoplanes sp. OR16]|uniref:hypothetical protein n=1 Tax=Actinoplanes sp. OR16 TaxID=946334 RepID=UPI000F6D3660|nr:hypothetical protein [Actinoplanes sp. OR16]BBH70156.1 hypothetical protein ACTI_68410 [Actinoplanes sp. OR16]